MSDWVIKHIKAYGGVISQTSKGLYHNPVDVISEYIANSWDADATRVEIDSESKKIVVDPKTQREAYRTILTIRDDGKGMTEENAYEHFAAVGRSEKKEGKSDIFKRPFLGCKGIGKFAAQYIADKIYLETVHKSDCSKKIIAEMDFEEITDPEKDMPYKTRIEELNYRQFPGTTMRFTLKKDTTIKADKLSVGLSRRLILNEIAKNYGGGQFDIVIQKKPLSEPDYLEDSRLVFPRDYEEMAKINPKIKEPEGLRKTENGWGIETIEDGYGKRYEIKWQFVFRNNVIRDDEDKFNGISVLCNGKQAQAPHFFGYNPADDMSGPPYLCGRIQADYLADPEADVIGAARQSIDWKDSLAVPLKEWGTDRIAELVRIARGKPPPPKRKREGLLSKKFKSCNDEKLMDLSDELKKITYRALPNASGALLRIFLEISIKLYFDKVLNEYYETNTNQGDDIGLRTKAKEALRGVKSKLKSGEYDAAKNQLSMPTWTPFYDKLNSIIHSPNFFPSPTDLKAGCRNLEPFLQVVHNEIRNASR